MTWTEKKFLFVMTYAGGFALTGKILIDRITAYDQPLSVLIKPGILGALSISCILYGFRLLKEIKKDLLQ